MNTSLSSFLKSYSALNQFNGSFGRKVTDAFPNNHFYSKESEQIGKVHRNTDTLYAEQQVQLQNLYQQFRNWATQFGICSGQLGQRDKLDAKLIHYEQKVVKLKQGSL